MNQLYEYDYYRATGKEWKWYKRFRLIHNIGLRYMFYLRKETLGRSVEKKIAHMLRLKMQRKFGLDINSLNIGRGGVIGHPHNISINSKAIIGSNVTIQNGVTIGKDYRGKRAGTPILGDNIYIGVNSTLVGNITIGNDVLIAPNSFINFDVPSHSIVIGVPGKIIHRENATEGFLLNKKT